MPQLPSNVKNGLLLATAGVIVMLGPPLPEDTPTMPPMPPGYNAPATPVLPPPLPTYVIEGGGTRIDCTANYENCWVGQ